MNIAKTIDQTNLKPDATRKDIIKFCQEALHYGFRAVCINPCWVRTARGALEKSEIKIATVIDFPLGASSCEARIAMAKKAKNDGADELDVVMMMGEFKSNNFSRVFEDLRALASILPVKVIIETGYLSDKEIKRAAELAVSNTGVFCVKTSTGFEPKTDITTKAKHVQLIREAIGPDFLIKAAGGIRTLRDVEILLEAGANIIGTSSGVQIVEEVQVFKRS